MWAALMAVTALASLATGSGLFDSVEPSVQRCDERLIPRRHSGVSATTSALRNAPAGMRIVHTTTAGIVGREVSGRLGPGQAPRLRIPQRTTLLFLRAAVQRRRHKWTTPPNCRSRAA